MKGRGRWGRFLQPFSRPSTAIPPVVTTITSLSRAKHIVFSSLNQVPWQHSLETARCSHRNQVQMHRTLLRRSSWESCQVKGKRTSYLHSDTSCTTAEQGQNNCSESESCSVQCNPVAQSCPTLCDPMNCSTPGLPVHHQLPEFTQTHVHQVSDASQPSHPLASPSPPAPNPSQHQSLSQWANSSHEVAKVLEFQLQHHSFQRNTRADLLQNGLIGSSVYIFSKNFYLHVLPLTAESILPRKFHIPLRPHSLPPLLQMTFHYSKYI